MEVDHIFIFSTNNGNEAEDLLRFGLTEGSSRVHKGQGTANRKFYFDNFFLELLWVNDEREIRQDPIKATQLWERANYQQYGFSRFGLCLVNTKATDELFNEAQIYQPEYFPQGMSIDILPNTAQPQLPWTFRLPYRGMRKAVSEPTKHENCMSKLTKVEFGLNEINSNSRYMALLENQESISFVSKPHADLILEFDHGKQQKTYNHEALDLTIRY